MLLLLPGRRYQCRRLKALLASHTLADHTAAARPLFPSLLSTTQYSLVTAFAKFKLVSGCAVCLGSCVFPGGTAMAAKPAKRQT